MPGDQDLPVICLALPLVFALAFLRLVDESLLKCSLISSRGTSFKGLVCFSSRESERRKRMGKFSEPALPSTAPLLQRENPLSPNSTVSGPISRTPASSSLGLLLMGLGKTRRRRRRLLGR